MKEVALTQGRIAIVDDEDLLSVLGHRWHYEHGYARAYKRGSGRAAREVVYMHRYILGDITNHVHHINGNTLDNRKCNLKVEPQATHNLRRLGWSVATCPFKGVYKRGKKWVAQITVKGKKRHLGTFEKDTDAALAYDDAAREAYGNVAFVNFQLV